MLDLLRRLSIALIVGICVMLLFVGGTLAKAESPAEDKSWIHPVKGTITDTFGTRSGKHKGIDIAAPEGTAISAVQSGTVTKSYLSNTYGHVVFISHPEGYETVYAHLSKRTVSEGVKVARGQKIGVIGNTGVSRGTHLHFEVHKGKWTYDKKQAVDPFIMVAAHSIEAVPATAQPAAEDGSVTVQKGDTLWGIAKRNGLSVDGLKKINGLVSDRLYAGQKLMIEQRTASVSQYTVKKGDTLYSIAEQLQITVQQLKQENDLSSEAIFPAQTLKITHSSASSK
ncbi:LysM peptidoglycan-binding domain-containing protein [Bacillus sp. FSL H8-0547]